MFKTLIAPDIAFLYCPIYFIFFYIDWCCGAQIAIATTAKKKDRAAKKKLQT